MIDSNALKNNEGKAEGDTAYYKDETGKVLKFSSLCPHAECLVKWNNLEKTWDCPCHGSRFEANGKLLQGPAGKDLDVK